ncbi:MAG: hypothetical protein BGP12_06915 [Rhodospirillales bacterium 70-18]|nr:MAG: hypothetical protein BGP12_06915 [Rhodospirillales bacterium 70-18]
MPYVDSIITKYIDILKAGNGTIKTYYQGEPLRIAQSNLPCCIISKTSTSVQPIDNADDQHSISLRITVITDVRQDLSSDESQAKIVEGVRSLYDILEGRNADYTLKSTSVLDILRGNINVDTSRNLRTDLSTATRVDYGTTLRDREKDSWTIEARLDFTCHFIQTR